MRSDTIIVGAGFAGLYMLHKLRQLGFSARVFESEDGVGGTWYRNRYPGARCDAQSLVYSYTFDEAVEREWRWSERYATQPEILRYLNFIADRLDLRKDIQFGSRVDAATFDDSANRWVVTLAGGETAAATYLIMASGALSAGRLPDIPGIESFSGESYHTGDWPHEVVNFDGKRVAVIGTGSSGVQAIPLIAQTARRLTVFQRTPTFTAPARNAPLTEEEYRKYDENRAGFRRQLKRGEIVGIGDVILADHLPPTLPSAVALSAEERNKIYEDRWQVGGALIARSFADTLINEEANRAMAEFFRAKIREIVKDPQVVEALSPTDYPIGSKRLCVGTDYYETFNRDGVELVDLLKTPIDRITPRGIATNARQYELDIIVFATGFDAMTGALARIDIRGASGIALRDEWAEGPKSYLGLSVAGFPNLFTVTGPGSPSVLGNVVTSIEQHVEWIADLLCHARSQGFARIEAEAAAQGEWSAHVTAAAAATLMMKGKSWYLGANVPGKPRVFMPYVRGIAVYRDRCDEVARANYPGFRLSASSTIAPSMRAVG
jgi:cyclohexanone monooxygenase